MCLLSPPGMDVWGCVGSVREQAVCTPGLQNDVARGFESGMCTNTAECFHSSTATQPPQHDFLRAGFRILIFSLFP